MTRHKRLISALVFACLLAATHGCVTIGWRNRSAAAAAERSLQAGNEALFAGRHDEAIEHFDAGLSRLPGHPTFLINKSAALRMRGVVRYNESMRLGDEGAKAAGKESAARDFREAESLATEVVNRLKSLGSEVLEKEEYGSVRVTAYAARAEALRLLVVTRFDKQRADGALAAIREYIEVEPDGAKRAKAQLGAAQMLLDAGKGDQAATEYKKIMAEDADNLAAVLGAGLALAQSGDRARYREAALYLHRFVEQAPDDHPLKASAKETLEFMKQQDAPAQAQRPGAGAKGVVTIIR